MNTEDLQKQFNKEFTEQAIILDRYTSKCHQLEHHLEELKDIIYELKHSVKIFPDMGGYRKAQVDIPAFIKTCKKYESFLDGK